MNSMISIGIDPGYALAISSLIWAPVQFSRAKYLTRRKIEVGHAERLVRPRKTVVRGGKVRTQEEERVISDADLLVMLAAARTELEAIRERARAERPNDPIVVNVERVRKVTPRRDRMTGRMTSTITTSMATALVNSEHVGGEICALARDIFGPSRVMTCTEQEWRSGVIGSPEGNETETQAVARVIRRAVDGWPDISNEHERDAEGIALYGARIFMVRSAAENREASSAIGRK